MNVQRSCSSDESGEISWSSGEEAERTFEAAINTPIRTKHGKRRLKQKGNVKKYLLDNSTKNYTPVASKSNVVSPTINFGVLRSSTNVNTAEREIKPGKISTSPVLKLIQKHRYSPILGAPASPINLNNGVKYLFTTLLSPELRIDSFISPEKQRNTNNESKSPVIAMKSKMINPAFKKKLCRKVMSTIENQNTNCSQESNIIGYNKIYYSEKNNINSINTGKVHEQKSCNAMCTPKNLPVHKLKYRSKSSATNLKMLTNSNVVPLIKCQTNTERVNNSHRELNTDENCFEVIQNPSSPVLSKKRPSTDLISSPNGKIIKKFKSYFDNNSSLDNTPISIQSSQNSEKTQKTTIDIEESNSPTPSQVSIVKIHTEISSSSKNSSRSSFTIKSDEEKAPKRRRKYKKDGLAGRLQSLIKKQRNQIFLWRHEVYLASNSNFVAPNSNPFRLFGIVQITPDFGCYVVDAIAIEDRKEYTVVLNTNYECNVTVSEKSFLKIFEPYEVLETCHGTVIFDVCKFQCIGDEEDKK